MVTSVNRISILQRGVFRSGSNKPRHQIKNVFKRDWTTQMFELGALVSLLHIIGIIWLKRNDSENNEENDFCLDFESLIMY